MAEISRRSEKIFKQRKKRRNHILMACIPLVLCISLYAAFVLPDAMSGSANLVNGSPEEMVPEIQGVYVKAAIRDNEGLRYVTDAEAVSNIFRAVQSLYNGNDASEALPEGSDQDSTEENRFTGADGAGFFCTVTFFAEQGDKTVYQLSGYDLLNASTGEKMTLTETQLKELKTALGLS